MSQIDGQITVLASWSWNPWVEQAHQVSSICKNWTRDFFSFLWQEILKWWWVSLCLDGKGEEKIFRDRERVGMEWGWWGVRVWCFNKGCVWEAGKWGRENMGERCVRVLKSAWRDRLCRWEIVTCGCFWRWIFEDRFSRIWLVYNIHCMRVLYWPRLAISIFYFIFNNGANFAN